MDGITDHETQALWIDVLGVEDLEKGPCIVKPENRQILIFKSGDDIFACNNRCPHEGYPLAEGTISDGCILTCNWHNWKFDLSNGATLVGGDRLRRYNVKTEGGRVFIDLAELSRGAIVENAIADLLDSFDDHDYSRMAREIARIMKAGGDPLDAVRATVIETHDKFEYGMSHALAVAADWLALYDTAADDPARRLTCLTEIVAYLAWDTRLQPPYSYPTKTLDFIAADFLAAIEAEDEGTAIAHVRGAMLAGLEFDDLYESLARAALAHYQDFGHSLIYVLKAREFVKAAGDDMLEPVLLQLVRSLIYASREDLIPEFKAYAPALKGWSVEKGTPNTETLRAGGVAKVLDEIRHYGGDPMCVYNALVDAAGWQMLHMDIGYSLATDGPVQNNVGWLDFTHALTFANAVRRTCSDFPDLWPAGLLQIGCFLGRNSKYVDPLQDTAIWRVDDALAYAKECRDGVVDHGQFEYIVAAHMLKLSHAITEEIEAQPDAAWHGTLASALNRFLNSPLKRKHPLRTARQALDLVRREG